MSLPLAKVGRGEILRQTDRHYEKIYVDKVSIVGILNEGRWHYPKSVGRSEGR